MALGGREGEGGRRGRNGARLRKETLLLGRLKEKTLFLKRLREKTLLEGILREKTLPEGSLKGKRAICGWEGKGKGGRACGEVFCGRVLGGMTAFCAKGGG